MSALTPVAVLMFRFNNPDALLVLLMVAGAYATVRAIENGSTKWLVWAGVFVGFGFLAKMLQALLVVPAFALAYLLFGPPKLGKRIVAAAARRRWPSWSSAGWYIAIVELVPASMRPYIGGSQNNSLLELTLGYNGLGRLNGDETGSVGGGGGGGWGETGLLRMFDAAQGGQISWLLPAALILLVGRAGADRRGRRAHRTGCGPGWCCGAAGCWSPGWCSASCRASSTRTTRWRWRRRSARWSAWAAALLWRARRNVVRGGGAGRRDRGDRLVVVPPARRCSPDFLPWLRWVVLVGGLVAAVGVLASLRLSGTDRGGGRGGRAGGGAGRAGGVRGADRVGAAHRLDPVGRAGGAGGGFGGRVAAVGGPGGGGPGGGGFPGGGAPGGGVPGGGTPGRRFPGGAAPGRTRPAARTGGDCGGRRWRCAAAAWAVCSTPRPSATR